MSSFEFSYYYYYYYYTFALFFLLLSLPCLPARRLHGDDPLTELTAVIQNNTWHAFVKLLDAGKGTHVSGMSDLKKYFHRFGYLHDDVPAKYNNNFTDLFDEDLESAVLRYQKNLGLKLTGKLDRDTMDVIMLPRCGMSDEHVHVDRDHDHSSALHVNKHFAYFYGKPRWTRSSPTTLSYAFSPRNMIDYIELSTIKSVFERAFTRWSSVIPVNFTESNEYDSADIKIGFYRGDHGDGEPFDGVLGVLAHAFSPENGRFHLDAAETWAVDFSDERSDDAIDLESVATHEIGHVLGLAHSSVKEAVMYPSLSPRTKKRDLKLDDVEGVQALYGSNPNFKYTSALGQDTSASSWIYGYGKWTTFLSMVLGLVFSSLC